MQAQCGRPGGNRAVRHRAALTGRGESPFTHQRAKAAAQPVPQARKRQRTPKVRDGESRGGRTVLIGSVASIRYTCLVTEWAWTSSNAGEGCRDGVESDGG